MNVTTYLPYVSQIHAICFATGSAGLENSRLGLELGTCLPWDTLAPGKIFTNKTARNWFLNFRSNKNLLPPWHTIQGRYILRRSQRGRQFLEKKRLKSLLRSLL